MPTVIQEQFWRYRAETSQEAQAARVIGQRVDESFVTLYVTGLQRTDDDVGRYPLLLRELTRRTRSREGLPLIVNG